MFPVNFECPVDVTKAYEEGGRWIVEGYAATSDFDLQADVITEEAIRASAKDLLENSTVLHNHNPDESIGRVMASRARKAGLFLKILVSKTVPQIWQQIREGVLNKFSVRGKVLDARKEWMPELKRYARMILKMRLVEVSLVAVPANPKARAVRWYVEKALDEFEESGGVIPAGGGGDDPTGGGAEMDGDVVIEEELLEASGEPGDEGDGGSGGGGDEGDPIRKDAGGEAAGAGREPAKQEAPPQQEPKPAPERGTRMRQIVELVDKLLAGEEDEERKKLLSQIRAVAAGATYTRPPASSASSGGETGKGEGGAGAGEPPAGENEVEKAGRKVSSARIARLKKLLDELKGFIEEVDVAGGEKKADAGGEAPQEPDPTVAMIAKALGIEAGKTGEVPNIAETVAGLKKRLDDLEGTPGERTSLDGQEDLAGEDRAGLAGAGKGKGSLWKGLV